MVLPPQRKYFTPRALALVLLCTVLALSATSGLQYWDKDAPGSPHYVPVLFGAYVMALTFLYLAGGWEQGWFAWGHAMLQHLGQSSVVIAVLLLLLCP
jgi:hypothetical protein